MRPTIRTPIRPLSAHCYPIVDVEQQVVLGIGTFLRKPGVKQLRNLLAQWFFVEDGCIRNIWASMFYPTIDLPVPNWPPHDGNLPFPRNSRPRLPLLCPPLGPDAERRSKG